MNFFNQRVIEIRKRSRVEKLEQIITLLKPTDHDRLLEVGIADHEYSEVDNFLIKNYPYQNRLAALSLGDAPSFAKQYPNVRLVCYAGGKFPLETNEFEIVHSNAVIEHVGQRDAQILFLSELVRVAKKGMITTPNKFYFIEVHTRIPFVHWFGKSIFDAVAKAIGKGWASGDYMYLLSYKDLDDLAKTVGLRNYRIIKNRFLCGVMTFTLVWEK